MVRHARPGVPMMRACQFDRKAADINAVQMQHRKDGRKTARGAAGGCFEHFGNFHRFDERIAGMTAPVVEVAGNDKRRVLGHQLFDAIFYQSDLFPAPMAKQSQVHIDAMKGLRPIGYCYFTMEQSAMLAVVHGNVFIVPSGDRIFAEDCVAMMAAIVNGVLAVGKIAPDRIGEESCCGAAGQLLCRVECFSCKPCTSCRNTTSAPMSRNLSRRSCTDMRRLNCEKPLWML